MAQAETQLGWPAVAELRRPGPATASTAPAGEMDIIGQVVKVGFLIRLAAVLAAVLGLVGTELTLQVLGAVVILVASSFVGLSQPRALATVIRHPFIAMADLVVVLSVIWILGVGSPLALAMLSTALLIGVLFRIDISLLLAVTMAVGYAGAVVVDPGGPSRLGFFLTIGMPVTLLCMVGLGQSIRRVREAQQMAELRLAGLLQANAVADERARLAREVHDSLAKSLQGLAFGAAALPSWVERDGARAGVEARALADGAVAAVQEARTLLTRMRSDEPAKPFDEVFGGVVRAWSDQHGRAVRFESDQVTALDADARYELLAAAREALENIQRHAPGAAVEVRMQAARRFVEVSITDHGPGFETQIQGQREAEGHFGLRGMSERLESVGGTARVESAPGQGTTVRLKAPTTDQNLLARR